MWSINRNVMFLQQFLSAIRQISSEFIFQQDSAPAHRALEAINSPHNFAKCWAIFKFFQNRLSNKLVIKSWQNVSPNRTRVATVRYMCR